MKKILFVCLLVILTAAIFTACGNKDIWDTQKTFDYAIIEFPGGKVRTSELYVKEE